MAYNSGFPVNYPIYAQQYAQPVQTPIQPSTGQNNAITWVQGEAGAKSYLVAPNNTVQLWDSESQTIYLKSADASGMPTMKVLDYTIREQSGREVPTLMQETSPEYVTKSEFDAFAEKMQRQIDKVSNRRREERSNGKSDI